MEIFFGLWGGVNHILATINEIIRFKLVFIIPLFLFYGIHKMLNIMKAKKKA